MRLTIWQISHRVTAFAVFLVTYSAFKTEVAALQQGDAATARQASEHNARWAAQKVRQQDSLTCECILQR